jgi:hypothetical protein
VDQQLIGREERRLLEGGDASAIAAMHGSGSVKDRASRVISAAAVKLQPA